jgi:hypothetical protein
MPYPPPAPPYVGPPYRKSSGNNKPIRRIVLHGTVSPTERGGARKIAAYFRSASAGGSAHYVVDPGEVVQPAYDSVICWHAPPNPNSLGVEFCDWVAANNGNGAPLPLSRWKTRDHTAMLKLGARLTAELCLAYGVPAKLRGPVGLRRGRHGICEHDDVSRAFGQSSHWDLGEFPRRRFLRMVRAEIEAIKNPTRPPTRVSRARELLDEALDQATAARRRRRSRRLRTALDNLPRR